jgi:hypothetical protein
MGAHKPGIGIFGSFGPFFYGMAFFLVGGDFLSYEKNS